jgi:hypothetical protein
MGKKTVTVLICVLALCISSVSVLAAYTIQQKISNEISSYTYLQAPIRLTKIGDLPAQIIPGETYKIHILTENIAKKAYKGSIVIQISTGWYYPITPMDPGNITTIRPDNTNYADGGVINSGAIISSNPVDGIVGPPIYYRQLSPNMITVKWNNVTLELTFNQTTNALVCQTRPFDMPVGFSRTSELAITFNDSACTDMGYYLTAWVEQA